MAGAGLVQATDLAQQARLQAARLLAGKGVAASPAYPDLTTRRKAWDVAQAFVEGQGLELLP